jgi:hypothetical protein
MSGSIRYGRECIAHGGQCQWPADQTIHGPVEPNCPDPSAHHPYQPRWPAIALNPEVQ